VRGRPHTASRRPALLRIALTGVLAALFATLALSSSASAAVPFCLPGTDPGQCSNPQGVATDWETGHVYVADRGNGRINVFESDGTFLSSFGEAQLDSPTWVAVDNDPASPSHHDVYVASENFEVQKFTAAGEFVKSFGGQGEGICQLTGTDDSIAVGPGGVIDVADNFDKDGAGPLHVFVNRVQQFDPEGKCLGEIKLFENGPGPVGEFIDNIAVDSNGNFYVTVEGASGVIRKYSPTGALLADLGGLETEGLSIDAMDNVFGKQRGQTPRETNFVAEYASNTNLIKRFSYSLA
jgi:DNA-binding beta-propeller fold protein YncE